MPPRAIHLAAAFCGFVLLPEEPEGRELLLTVEDTTATRDIRIDVPPAIEMNDGIERRREHIQRTVGNVNVTRRRRIESE